MARERSKVSGTKKKKLRAEAGGKCANPGCPNMRTHIHHIREWAVYSTHDEHHMIAVCPTCHDAVHHGTLQISDEVVYRWKEQRRQRGIVRTHVYVEPGDNARLLLGSVCVVAASGQVVVFELSNMLRLRLSVRDNDIILVDVSVRALNGEEVLRVVDNYILHKRDDTLVSSQVPGHVRLEAQDADRFIPPGMIDLVRQHEPDFARDSLLPLLDLEALKPGLLRVQGVWVDGDCAIVVTEHALSFLQPGLRRPFSIVGAGEKTTLVYAGPIDKAMFGFAR